MTVYLNEITLGDVQIGTFFKFSNDTEVFMKIKTYKNNENSINIKTAELVEFSNFSLINLVKPADILKEINIDIERYL